LSLQGFDENSRVFSLAKIGVIAVLSMMLSQEISQSLNNMKFSILHLYRYTKKFDLPSKVCKWYQIFIFLLNVVAALVPPIIQFIVAFFIEDYSILIIMGSPDPITLIQNFAGLVVVVDFDQYVITFLRNTGLGIIIGKIFEVYQIFLDFINKKENEKKGKQDFEQSERNNIPLIPENGESSFFMDYFNQLFDDEDDCFVVQSEKDDHKYIIGWCFGWINKWKFVEHCFVFICLIAAAFFPYWERN